MDREIAWVAVAAARSGFVFLLTNASELAMRCDAMPPLLPPPSPGRIHVTHLTLASSSC